MAVAAALSGFVPLSMIPAHAAPVSVEAADAPSFANLVSAVSPTVVSVRAQSSSSPAGSAPSSSDAPSGRNPMEELFGGLIGRSGDAGEPGGFSDDVRPVSQGSGFLISSDGYVVTNDDIVAGGDAFQVILNDGTAFPARMVGEDQRTDVALLKVDAKKRDFAYAGFADDTKVRIGDWLVAVGNPFGLGGTVTAGIVSARGRDVGANPYDDFIQFDALVNRGDAGGPAFDLTGKVVGMNAAVFSPGGGNAGIAFAIPAATVKHVVAELMKNGTVKRGWLGVELQPVGKEIAESVGLSSPSGALIANVADDTPASKAGLAAGDVVTGIDGRKIGDPRALARAVATLHPGTSIKLGIWRHGSAKTVKVDLGSSPDSHAKVDRSSRPAVAAPSGPTSPLSRFGLTVVPADNGTGVVITDVEPDSPADRRGLRPGDVILSVSGRSVKSANAVLSAIGEAAKHGRKAALFRVENGNRSRFVALPIDLG